MLLKQNRLNYKNSLTLAYQLGYVIGERISTKVPVLSCDWLKTDNVIQITEEEMEHHESLDEKQHILKEVFPHIKTVVYFDDNKNKGNYESN